VLRAVAAGGIATAAAFAVLGVAGHRVFATAGFVALAAAALAVFCGALLGILPGAAVHSGLIVFILVAASHVFAVATGHGLAGVGLITLVFLMIAAGTSGFCRWSVGLRRGSLLGHNREPSSQRENRENCSHANFHFITFRSLCVIREVGSASHAGTGQG